MIRPDELEDRMQRGALVRGGLTSRAPERPLTPRQAVVLAKLRDYEAVTGEAMPLRVLARSLGMTPAGAAHHVDALEAKGYSRTSRQNGN
jgi:DNA-binding MarR family transcriptional regulator